MARLGLSRRGAFTPGLPIPYPALRNAGLRIGRGQTSLTVAAPGVGKSQLWLNFAQRMKVPTLYWSADTDEGDVTARTIALWTGQPATEVKDRLSDDTWAEWYFEKLGNRSSHVEWLFDSPISPKRTGERLNAFAELYGEYPHLVVIDNMSNAITNPADEYSQIKEFQTGVQVLARETKAHIAVLHHAKGEYDSGVKPIPQSGGLQNPFKIPELGITLYRPNDGSLGVCTVKNRGGVSDPAAKHPVVLPIDFARSLVQGYEPER